MRLRLLCALLGAALAVSAPAHATGYGDWAAIVVAGDWHAHSGAPSEVFDNARRDIASDLTHMGFQPQNIEQFSVNPDRYPDAHAQHSDSQTIANALWDLSNRTSGGCLLYFTSHGSPDGIVMDDTIFSPDKMQQIISNACGDRPTVVIVSACFSGVFVPVLAAPDRFVFTAARPDSVMGFPPGSRIATNRTLGAFSRSLQIAFSSLVADVCIAGIHIQLGCGKTSAAIIRQQNYSRLSWAGEWNHQVRASRGVEANGVCSQQCSSHGKDGDRRAIGSIGLGQKEHD